MQGTPEERALWRDRLLAWALHGNGGKVGAAEAGPRPSEAVHRQSLFGRDAPNGTAATKVWALT